MLLEIVIEIGAEQKTSSNGPFWSFFFSFVFTILWWAWFFRETFLLGQRTLQRFERQFAHDVKFWEVGNWNHKSFHTMNYKSEQKTSSNDPFWMTKEYFWKFDLKFFRETFLLGQRTLQRFERKRPFSCS